MIKDVLTINTKIAGKCTLYIEDDKCKIEKCKCDYEYKDIEDEKIFPEMLLSLSRLFIFSKEYIKFLKHFAMMTMREKYLLWNDLKEENDKESIDIYLSCTEFKTKDDLELYFYNNKNWIDDNKDDNNDFWHVF